MLTVVDLTSIARARLADAKALLSSGRFDGAAYLCGYSVEMALKARIVKTLRWVDGFPEEGGDFTGLQSFKTHNLGTLLHLSGWKPKIRTKFAVQWSNVSQWDPESRYERPGGVTQAQAQAMIESSKVILKALL